MGLNIKNEETYRLVHELAELTGETMTAAINQAVRERLARLRKKKAVRLSERLIEIGKDCARHLKEPYRSAKHDELLFDERGLPL